jgi:hypothetical protein
LISKGHEVVELKLDLALENELAVAFPRLVSSEGKF